MAEIKPVRRVTHYEVTCVPDSDAFGESFAITVAYRGEGRWAVQNRGRWLGTDGTWSWGYRWEGDPREPVTEEEMDSFERGREAWLAVHRFDEETALHLADEAAPKMTVGRYTVADALAEMGVVDA
jgi:hypothetical protein